MNLTADHGLSDGQAMLELTPMHFVLSLGSCSARGRFVGQEELQLTDEVRHFALSNTLLRNTIGPDALL